MADPVTTAITTFSGYQQSKGQEKLAQYQANIADQNRKTVLAQGAQEEIRMRREQRRFIGAQRAGLSEAGIFGRSSTELLEESMINSEMDILNKRAEAAQQGVNYLQQATIKRFEGKQYGRQARMTLLAGGVTIAGQLAKAAYSPGSGAGAGAGAGGGA